MKITFQHNPWPQAGSFGYQYIMEGFNISIIRKQQGLSSLAPLGESLLSFIDAMNHWGNDNRAYLEKVISKTNPEVSMA